MQPTLTAEQQVLLEAILAWVKDQDRPYLTVGGYAGTGKTTLIGALRRELQRTKLVSAVAFCAYTGKAASVLRETLQGALQPGDSCTTVHSLIYTARTDEGGSVLGWERVKDISAQLIVVDEGSMLNQLIWADLRSYNVPILVVGDHGQLPPVEGNFHLLEKPDLRLETIVRQAADNPIIRLSAHVRKGGEIPFGNFGAVRKIHLGDDSARETFEELVRQPETLCLAGTNRTRVRLNGEIRGLRGFEGQLPERGEQLICLKNNHAKLIFNGMTGTLEKLYDTDDPWYEVKIAMSDKRGIYEGKILKAQFNQAKTLRGTEATKLTGLSEKEPGDLFDFGYCVTVHKAQGSEADQVVVFEERIYGYTDDLWRRWLYTAITRAKERLIIFAS